MYSIYDINGKLNRTFVTNDQEISIDLSDLISGIYFLKIINEDKAKVFRIVKM